MLDPKIKFLFDLRKAVVTAKEVIDMGPYP